MEARYLTVALREEVAGVTVTLGFSASPEALMLFLQGDGSESKDEDIRGGLRHAIERRLQLEVRALLDEVRRRLQLSLVEESCGYACGYLRRAGDDE